MTRLAVALVSVVSAALAGCVSGPNPQQRFDARVRQFGMPDYVEAPGTEGRTTITPGKYARQSDVTEAPEQVFHYLARNEQVAFRPGQPPKRGPINPDSRRMLDQIPAEEERLRQELPGIMKQARDATRQQGGQGQR